MPWTVKNPPTDLHLSTLAPTHCPPKFDSCGFLCRSRTWRCTLKTAIGRGPSASFWAKIASITGKPISVAGTRWRWTSRLWAGIGSSRPRSTMPITVRESVRLCSWKIAIITTSTSSTTSQAPVRVALPASRATYPCCTMTVIITSTMVCCLTWWWTRAGAVRNQIYNRCSDHALLILLHF